MNEILLGSLIDKVDAQDRKIEDLNKKVHQTPSYEQVLGQFKMGIEGLRTDVQKISSPEKEMSELSGRLITCIELLKRPDERKIIHHHHVTKIIWISVGLFLVLCLASTAWFNTYNELELYKSNDTKYRYLKLKSFGGLRKSLNFIDSLYQVDPKMREYVIAKEEQNQRDFEMMNRALQMEKEAKKLEKKVNKKG
jgi:hypothetical protein